MFKNKDASFLIPRLKQLIAHDTKGEVICLGSNGKRSGFWDPPLEGTNGWISIKKRDDGTWSADWTNRKDSHNLRARIPAWSISFTAEGELIIFCESAITMHISWSCHGGYGDESDLKTLAERLDMVLGVFTRRQMTEVQKMLWHSVT